MKVTAGGGAGRDGSVPRMPSSQRRRVRSPPRKPPGADLGQQLVGGGDPLGAALRRAITRPQRQRHTAVSSGQQMIGPLPSRLRLLHPQEDGNGTRDCAEYEAPDEGAY
jgi:hypothetical protein